jgi:hypothetical protein
MAAQRCAPIGNRRQRCGPTRWRVLQSGQRHRDIMNMLITHHQPPAKPSASRPRPCTALCALALTALLTACGGDDDNDGPPAATEVTTWNRFASTLVAANQAPAFQVHSMALVQIAVHDAVNATQPRYAAYAYTGTAPGASLAAAVAAATHDTLLPLVPAAAAAVEAEYSAGLARIADGAAKDAGVAAGRAAAAAILAQRAADNVGAAVGKPYTPDTPAPGVYQLTPPANIVIGAGLGELAPMGVADVAALRSPAPHAIGSSHYTLDYDEVKTLGSAASTTRTGQQTETARFWFDVVTQEWHDAARQGLAATAADESQAARTLALMSVAMFDAVVASMETKFSFNFWRPITAIRGGDDDGNAATQGDANWEPLCATPPFPEHNSTHAVTGAAAAGVLARTLGDQHAFTIDSPTLPGVRRTYQRFSDAAVEEAESRIYCGIHFRRGMDTGLAQGEQVAEQVVGRTMRPVAAGQ